MIERPDTLRVLHLTALALLLAHAGPQASAQDWDWARRAGGVERESGYEVAVDAAGNVYVAGYMAAIASFGDVTLTSAGAADIFVAKYGPGGDLLWVRRAGGPSTDVANGIALDGAGNAYVTGTFRGMATFGNVTLTSGTAEDIFVAKYSPSGQVVWAKRGGGAQGAIGYAIAANEVGQACVTGGFRGTGTFGTTWLQSQGNADIIVLCFAPNGDVLWARSFGGLGGENGYGVAFDAAGNVLVTGTFSGTAFFQSTPVVSAGQTDVFVLKLAADGTMLWVRRAGGLAGDYGYALAVDSEGHAWLTGFFEGTAEFGALSLTSAGNYDAFVARYAPDGEVAWARRAGGTGYDGGLGIAVDAVGDALVTGVFSDTAAFGGATLGSAGSTDVFVARYSAAGDAVGVHRAGGPSFDYAYGIAPAPPNAVYVTGEFLSVAGFGPDSLASTGSYDIFVARLSMAAVAGETAPHRVALGLSAPYPNPLSGEAVLHLTMREPGPVTVTVHDLLGRQLRTLLDAALPGHAEHPVRFDARDLPAGPYVVRVRSGAFAASRLVSVVR